MYGSSTLRLALTFHVFLFISYVYGHVSFHPNCPHETCPYVRKGCRLKTTFIHEGVPCEGCPIDMCKIGGQDNEPSSDKNNKKYRERPIAALLERLRRPRRRNRPTEQSFLQERHNQRESILEREHVLHDLPRRGSNDRTRVSGIRDASHDLGVASDNIDPSFFSDIPLRHQSKARPRSRSKDILMEGPSSNEPNPWNRDLPRERRVDSVRLDHSSLRSDSPLDLLFETSGGEPRVINHGSLILSQTEPPRTNPRNRKQDTSMSSSFIDTDHRGGVNRNDILEQKLDELRRRTFDTSRRNTGGPGADISELLRRNLDAPLSGTRRNDILANNIDSVGVDTGMNDMLKRNLDTSVSGTHGNDAFGPNLENFRSNSINDLQRQTHDTLGSSGNRNEMLMKNLDTVGIGSDTNEILRKSLETTANSANKNDMLLRNLDTLGTGADTNSMLMKNLDASGGNGIRNDMLMKNLDTVGASTDNDNVLMRNLEITRGSSKRDEMVMQNFNSDKSPSANIGNGRSRSNDMNPPTPGLVPLLPMNPFDLGNFAQTARNEANPATIQLPNSISDASQQMSSQVGRDSLSDLFDKVPKSSEQNQNIPFTDSAKQSQISTGMQPVQNINPQMPVQSIQAAPPSINQQQLSTPSSNPRIMPIPIMQTGFNGMIPNILGVPFSPIQLQVISTIMSQMRPASGFPQSQFPQTNRVGFPSPQLPQTGGTGFQGQMSHTSGTGFPGQMSHTSGTGFPGNQQLQMQQNQLLPFPNGGSAANLAGSIPPVTNGGIQNVGSSSASFGIGGIPNTGMPNNQIQNRGLVGVNAAGSIPQIPNAGAVNLNAHLTPPFSNRGQSPLNLNSQGLNRGALMGSLFPFPNAGASNNMNFVNPAPQLPFPSNQFPQSPGTNVNVPQSAFPNAVGTGINPAANVPSVNTLTPTTQPNQAPIPQRMSPGSTFTPGSSIDDELHRLLTSVTSLDADGQFLDSNGQSVLDTSLLSGPPSSSATGQSLGSVGSQANSAPPLFDMLALVNTPQISPSPNSNSIG